MIPFFYLTSMHYVRNACTKQNFLLLYLTEMVNYGIKIGHEAIDEIDIRLEGDGGHRA